MKDAAFLELSPDEARRHIAFLGDDVEADRLRRLYLDRNGVALGQTDGSTAEGGNKVDVASSSGLGGIAWALILAGIVCTGWAFLFDVGVSVDSPYLSGSSEIANADRMAIREMILLVGLASFVGGCIFAAADSVAKAVLRSGRPAA